MELSYFERCKKRIMEADDIIGHNCEYYPKIYVYTFGKSYLVIGRKMPTFLGNLFRIYKPVITYKDIEVPLSDKEINMLQIIAEDQLKKHTTRKETEERSIREMQSLKYSEEKGKLLTEI